MIKKKKSGWSRKKKLIAAGIAAFMIVSVFIAVTRGKGGPSESDVRTTPVVVETAQRGTLVERVHLTGDIKGQNQADIYPDVPGRINRVHVREGQYVSQGQVVADIDRNVVGMVYRPATVTAPISGVIGKIYVDVGMTIAPNVPMMLIADTRVVEGILAVPEKFVPYFQVGQTAEVRLQSYPDEVFSGTISNKGSMIDPATRTLQVRIRLSNPGGKILPGNYADFSVQIREARDQVKVPFDAVIDTIERQFVFVAVEKDRMLEPDTGGDRTMRVPDADKDKDAGAGVKFYQAELRPVQLGIQDGGWVQIISGLSEGERVVTFGKENVIDQAWLRIVSQRSDNANEAAVETSTNSQPE